MSEWPIVLQNDDGIRPAGRPDECFYCDRKVGEEHKDHCVVVKKKVEMKYIFTIERYVPYFWDKTKIESYFNESGWCADNSIDDLENQDGDCLCDIFECEFLNIIDDTPKRLTKEEADAQE